MNLYKLLEQTESGNKITSSDNFDIIPVKFPKLKRSLNSINRKRNRKSNRNRTSNRNRKRNKTFRIWNKEDRRPN